MRIAAMTCIAAFLFSLPAGLAHEGHDHDNSAKGLAGSTFPRVTAHSELYEVVGILKNARLTIYVDRFGSNEPVTDAKVQVTVGDRQPVDAEPAENGTYSLALSRATGSGPLEVIFSITASGGDDLLAGSIALAEGPATATIPGAGAAWLRWVAAIPAPIRNPIVLSVAIFGLGVMFGQFHRRRVLVPTVASGVATVVALGLLVAVALSDEGQGPNRSAAHAPPSQAAMSDAPRRLPDGTVFVGQADATPAREIRTVPAQARNGQPGRQSDRPRDRRSEPDQRRSEHLWRARYRRWRRPSAHRPNRPQG